MFQKIIHQLKSRILVDDIISELFVHFRALGIRLHDFHLGI